MNRCTPKQWFANQRIRNKIVLLYIPLILVPLLILGIVSYRIYTDAIIERTKKSVSDNSTLVLTRLDGMLNSAESYANMMTLSLNRILPSGLSTANGGSDLRTYTQITNELNYARLVFTDVSSSAFIDMNNRLYGSTSDMERQPNLAVTSDLVARIARTNGTNLWFPMQKRAYLSPDEHTAVLTLGKKITNINTGQQLGFLIVNVKESAILSIYKEISSARQGSYFIADEEGTVISSPIADEVLKPVADPLLREGVMNLQDAAEIRDMNGERMLLAGLNYPKLGWKLVSVTPLKALTADIQSMTQVLVVIGAVCLLFGIGAAGLLTRVIARPMIRLARCMSQFHEGQLDVRLDIGSSDEIGYVASGFNTMIRKIKDLLDDVKTEQRKKREYELALIQAQIRPHFLYNTLDVIYVLSDMNRPKDAQITTKALADFYRAVLSKGRELITIGEELQNVRDYLAIQRIRYSDVFDYRIEIGHALMACYIPKLTLQPLVENAIYHGLKEKNGFGTLRIVGSLEGDQVRLQIVDDGVGITEERLQDIRRAKRGGSAPVSYGLNNVDDRIKLYFGDEYGIHIATKVGRGTTVTITLPQRTEGEM